MERFAVFPDVLSGRTVFVPHQIGAGVELRLGPTDDPEKPAPTGFTGSNF